jgi:hypothetical protein
MIKFGFSEDSEKLAIIRLSGIMVGIILLLHVSLDYLFVYHSLKFQNHTTIIVEIAVGIFIGFSLHIWNQRQQSEIKNIAGKNTELISKITTFLDNQTKIQTDREYTAYIAMENHLRRADYEFQSMIDGWDDNSFEDFDALKSYVDSNFEKIQNNYDRFYTTFSQSASILYDGHSEQINTLHQQFSQNMQVARVTRSLQFVKLPQNVIKRYLEFLDPFVADIVRKINAETAKIHASKTTDPKID